MIVTIRPAKMVIIALICDPKSGRAMKAMLKLAIVRVRMIIEMLDK